MSRALLGSLHIAAELKREVDDPLDLQGVQAPPEAWHRPIALPDAPADGRAVATAHHGGGEQVQVRIEDERIGIALPFPALAMAAGAVGRVHLRSGEVLMSAAGPQRTEERQ